MATTNKDVWDEYDELLAKINQQNDGIPSDLRAMKAAVTKNEENIRKLNTVIRLIGQTPLGRTKRTQTPRNMPVFLKLKQARDFIMSTKFRANLERVQPRMDDNTFGKAAAKRKGSPKELLSNDELQSVRQVAADIRATGVDFTTASRAEIKRQIPEGLRQRMITAGKRVGLNFRSNSTAATMLQHFDNWSIQGKHGIKFSAADVDAPSGREDTPSPEPDSAPEETDPPELRESDVLSTPDRIRQEDIERITREMGMAGVLNRARQATAQRSMATTIHTTALRDRERNNVSKLQSEESAWKSVTFGTSRPPGAAAPEEDDVMARRIEAGSGSSSEERGPFDSPPQVPSRLRDDIARIKAVMIQAKQSQNADVAGNNAEAVAKMAIQFRIAEPGMTRLEAEEQAWLKQSRGFRRRPTGAPPPKEDVADLSNQDAADHETSMSETDSARVRTDSQFDSRQQSDRVSAMGVNLDNRQSEFTAGEDMDLTGQGEAAVSSAGLAEHSSEPLPEFSLAEPISREIFESWSHTTDNYMKQFEEDQGSFGLQNDSTVSAMWDSDQAKVAGGDSGLVGIRDSDPTDNLKQIEDAELFNPTTLADQEVADAYYRGAESLLKKGIDQRTLSAITQRSRVDALAFTQQVNEMWAAGGPRERAAIRSLLANASTPQSNFPELFSMLNSIQSGNLRPFAGRDLEPINEDEEKEDEEQVELPLPAEVTAALPKVAAELKADPMILGLSYNNKLFMAMRQEGVSVMSDEDLKKHLSNPFNFAPTDAEVAARKTKERFSGSDQDLALDAADEMKESKSPYSLEDVFTELNTKAINNGIDLRQKSQREAFSQEVAPMLGIGSMSFLAGKLRKKQKPDEDRTFDEEFDPDVSLTDTLPDFLAAMIGGVIPGLEVRTLDQARGEATEAAKAGQRARTGVRTAASVEVSDPGELFAAGQARVGKAPKRRAIQGTAPGGAQHLSEGVPFHEYAFSDHPTKKVNEWITEFGKVTEFHPSSPEHIQEMKKRLGGVRGQLMMVDEHTGRRRPVTLLEIKIHNVYVFIPDGKVNHGGSFWPAQERAIHRENDAKAQYHHLRGGSDKRRGQHHRMKMGQLYLKKKHKYKPHVHDIKRHKAGSTLFHYVTGKKHSKKHVSSGAGFAAELKGAPQTSGQQGHPDAQPQSNAIDPFSNEARAKVRQDMSSVSKPGGSSYLNPFGPQVSEGQRMSMVGIDQQMKKQMGRKVPTGSLFQQSENIIKARQAYKKAHPSTNAFTQAARWLGGIVTHGGEAVKQGAEDFADSSEQIGRDFVDNSKKSFKSMGEFFEHPSLQSLGQGLAGLGNLVLGTGKAALREAGAVSTFVQDTPVLSQLNTITSVIVPGLGAVEAAAQIGDSLSRGDIKGAGLRVVKFVALREAGLLVGKGVAAGVAYKNATNMMAGIGEGVGASALKSGEILANSASTLSKAGTHFTKNVNWSGGGFASLADPKHVVDDKNRAMTRDKIQGRSVGKKGAFTKHIGTRTYTRKTTFPKPADNVRKKWQKGDKVKPGEEHWPDEHKTPANAGGSFPNRHYTVHPFKHGPVRIEGFSHATKPVPITGLTHTAKNKAMSGKKKLLHGKEDKKVINVELHPEHVVNKRTGLKGVNVPTTERLHTGTKHTTSHLVKGTGVMARYMIQIPKQYSVKKPTRFFSMKEKQQMGNTYYRKVMHAR
jgi:hypothetical protein